MTDRRRKKLSRHTVRRFVIYSVRVSWISVFFVCACKQFRSNQCENWATSTKQGYDGRILDYPPIPAAPGSYGNVRNTHRKVLYIHHQSAAAPWACRLQMLEMLETSPLRPAISVQNWTLCLSSALTASWTSPLGQ